MDVVSLFSGAGGLSLGAEMAGIRISSAIEINPPAAKTFQRNHKGAKVLQGDIQKIDPKNIRTSEIKRKYLRTIWSVK